MSRASPCRASHAYQFDQAKATQLLYQALAEPIGLALQANDPKRACQRLYAARAKACDPALFDLQFQLLDTFGGNFVINHQKITGTADVP